MRSDIDVASPGKSIPLRVKLRILFYLSNLSQGRIGDILWHRSTITVRLYSWCLSVTPLPSTTHTYVFLNHFKKRKRFSIRLYFFCSFPRNIFLGHPILMIRFLFESLFFSCVFISISFQVL